MANIALLLESDGPGGAERMLLHLAAALRARGHNVFPVGPGKGCGWLADQFRRYGFTPQFFHLRAALDPICVAELAYLLKRNKIDIVHSHEFTMAVYGSAAAQLTRLPHVITMHGGDYFSRAMRRRKLLRWACLRSQAVVSVSNASRSVLSEALGLPESSVTVVHNGITFIPGDPIAVRKEIKSTPYESIIVSIGNLYPVKGHSVLLKALAELNTLDPDFKWRLLIVGRGMEEAKLREIAADNHMSDRVHLLGYRNDIDNILAAANVTVLPSLSEGLPVALLEAMFAGKPIIASNTGGIPEVVKHELNAILVPPGDSTALAKELQTMLKNSEMRLRLGNAAQKRAKESFSIDHMVNAYESVYQTGRVA